MPILFGFSLDQIRDRTTSAGATPTATATPPTGLK